MDLISSNVPESNTIKNRQYVHKHAQFYNQISKPVSVNEANEFNVRMKGIQNKIIISQKIFIVRIVGCHLKAGLSESRRASIATQRLRLLSFDTGSRTFDCWKPESPPPPWVELRVGVS
jgi:hypothetical protein